MVDPEMKLAPGRDTLQMAEVAGDLKTLTLDMSM